MNASHVVVTGAQGFVGRYVVGDWLRANPDVKVIGLGRSPQLDDHFTHRVHTGTSEVPAPLPPFLAEALRTERYRYVQLDVADAPAVARVLADVRPDIIIHLAGSLRDDPPAQLVRANIETVACLFEGVQRVGLDSVRIVFGSSGSVYGYIPGRHPPLAEDAACAPLDPYAATKYAAEILGQILARDLRGAVLWARIFNPVGPGQDERHLCGWLGWQIAAIARRARPPILSVGPLSSTRDFIDVRDVAAGLRSIATKGEPGLAYNVASGRETSCRQVLEKLVHLAGLAESVSIEERPPRRADLPRHYADISRLVRLGFTPQYDLDRSLRHLLAYYARYATK
jgi:GDP-4-dehydro-6-deoxy-D-mannose reductase